MQDYHGSQLIFVSKKYLTTGDVDESGNEFYEIYFS